MSPVPRPVLQRLLLVSPLLVSLGARAADAPTPDAGNSAWILSSTALVLFMTLPGLALFYGGLVRSKNVLNVLMQCFSIACVSSLLWYLVGYSIAFAPGNGFIGGLDRVGLAGMEEGSLSGTLPESVFVMFQMTFAIITPALIIGGIAERARFSAVMLFSGAWLLCVYAPVTHWVWGGGWLQQMGLLDFAGGTVVHVTAGVASLVSALVVGNRHGFGQTAMPPHNMTMTVTGAGMLWVGWFGFNAGSALAANGDAGMAMLVTHLSAAAGAFTWLCVEWVRFGKPSALGAVTGMVAGLGTITPASGFVGPAAAVLIGCTAGVACFFATLWLKRVMSVDDSLDVFPVHGVGGVLGTLAAGIFASSGLGVLSGQGLREGVSIASQLATQACGVASVALYTAIVTWVLLKVVGLVTPLRVSVEEETEGLDVVLHNERGYDL
jgi:ammonium transporter, Amt family